jgi:hypothetical protein
MAILMEHINASVPRPSLRTDEERALYSVIERLLAKKPADRFQSAEELIAALVTAPATRGGASQRSDGAGLSPTRQMPAVTGHSVLDAATRLVQSQRPRLERVRSAITARAALATTFAASRTPRFRATSAVVVGLAIGGYYAIHFATMHRSRCPTQVVGAVSSAPDAGKSGAEANAAFSLLVDAVGTRAAGGDLDVYYDVCGLDDDGAYSVAIRVARNGSVFKRILGTGVAPITVSYDEMAGGPAVRRHRTLDIDDMPAGSYKLAVSVTDAAGRRRDRETDFQLLDP